MTRQIFRRSALDRLGSPEQLDRPSQLVRTHGWIALAALAAGVVGGSTWAVIAKAPVKVEAAGILFDEGQLMDVASATSGRIVSLHFAAGTEVLVGDVIATVARPELELELDKTRADLVDVKNRLAEMQTFFRDREDREKRAEEDRLTTLEQTHAHITRRISLLNEKVAGVKNLLQRKLLVRDRLIESELQLSTARERLLQLEDERQVILLKRLERESKTRLSLLDEQLKLNGLKRRARSLERRLTEQQFVRSPHSGRVAETKVASGDIIAAGTKLVTLMQHHSSSRGMTALLYVSPRDGRRIEKGMVAEIVPSTIRKEEFGFVSGRVEVVSEVAATAEGMRSVLKNEQLVARLSGEGAPVAIRVHLEGDPSTASGLKWSLSKGPLHRINTGTLLDGHIVVERVSILTLVAPQLEGLMNAWGLRSHDGN
jgi:HlyD family secretion protein